MKVWKEVVKVQRMRPGWRFSLLGGDVSYGYNRTKNGRISKHHPIDYSQVVEFGWRAEFFGDIDPSKDAGQRRVQVAARTAEGAVREACKQAIAVIKRERASAKEIAP